MPKSTVGQMTTDEFKVMLGDLFDQKLTEFFGDPDEGLVIRKSVRDRLIRQQKAVKKGERGKSLDDVKKRLHIV